MPAPFHGIDQQNVHQDGQLFDTKAVLEPIHRQLKDLEKNLEKNLERQLTALVAGFDTMLQRQQQIFVSALKDVQSEVASVKLAMQARNEEGHSPFVRTGRTSSSRQRTGNDLSMTCVLFTGKNFTVRCQGRRMGDV